MGIFMFNQYDSYDGLKTVMTTGDKIYLIQQGVYSSNESMEKNTTAFEHYIYTFQDDKYYVYVGATKELENLEKLKGYYKELGYDIYVKETMTTNKEFLDILENYDAMLMQTTDKELINSICGQVLNKYGELVDGEYQN